MAQELTVDKFNQFDKPLSHFSLKGKAQPWRQRKIESGFLAQSFLRISDRYSSSSNLPTTDDRSQIEQKVYFQKYSESLGTCGDYLHFDECSKNPNHYNQFDRAFFCRKSFCQMCSWRKSKKGAFQLSEVLAETMARNSGSHPIFLTVTVPNAPGDVLKNVRIGINHAYAKLTKRVCFQHVLGHDRTFELTRNEHTGEFHPHLHIALVVSADYKGDGYVNRSQYKEKVIRDDSERGYSIERLGKLDDKQGWLDHWRDCYGDQLITQVDIRGAHERGVKMEIANISKSAVTVGGDFKAESQADYSGLATELSKYMVKGSDLFRGLDLENPDDEAELDQCVMDLYFALHRANIRVHGGVIREIFKEKFGKKKDSVDSEEVDLNNVGEEKLTCCPNNKCSAPLRSTLYGFKKADYYCLYKAPILPNIEDSLTDQDHEFLGKDKNLTLVDGESLFSLDAPNLSKPIPRKSKPLINPNKTSFTPRFDANFDQEINDSLTLFFSENRQIFKEVKATWNDKDIMVIFSENYHIEEFQSLITKYNRRPIRMFDHPSNYDYNDPDTYYISKNYVEQFLCFWREAAIILDSNF